CRVDLGFEQYRFPGFPVPPNETPFSYLSELCWEGARRRYHPLTAALVNRLAHELDVIERAGLAEFFLICWDLMRYAREHGIPARGRGRATSSIVSYTLCLRRGASRAAPAGFVRTRWSSRGSSRSSTTGCSSGSSTRDGRRIRTSTSTSA